MQYTHTFLKYYLPGLSADSALHYPTLPWGPPSATLAPKNIQLSDICKALVNQKPAKPLSQLEILESLFFVDAQIKIQAQTPKSPQHPKSHLKIKNLTSKSQISTQIHKISKQMMLCLRCFLFNIVFDGCLLFGCCGMSLAKRSLLGYVGKQTVMLLLTFVWGKNDVFFLFNVILQQSA